MINFNLLNSAQRKAVETLNGPVMCIAGAGTGKTRVLTYRFANLINHMVEPERILAVTFTNKAANEMKERINTLTNIDTSNMYISTFHSFCLRLLRKEDPEIFGYKEDFYIIDEEDSKKIIKEAIDDLKLKDEELKVLEVTPSNVQDYITRTENDVRFDFNDFEQRKIYEKLSKMYHEKLIEKNVMDFDSIVTVFLDLIKKNPIILKKYQNQFKYILIDEFQDTNNKQYELIKLLSELHKNVFIVGDQDQSIYSFRGAKVKNIDLFMRDFPDYKLIKLEENYRSTPEILNLANGVISKNTSRIDKVLTTENQSIARPEVWQLPSDNDETKAIFEEIIRLTGKGYKYSDITILYRQNSFSRQFEQTFKRYRVPYQIYGGISFFARKEVKDILAFIRLAINCNDNVSFDRIINVPARNIGQKVQDMIYVESIRHNVSMFNALYFLNEEEMQAKAIEGVNNFKNIILQIKTFIDNCKYEDSKEIIDLIIKLTKYDEYLKADKKIDYKEKIQNIYELKSLIRQTNNLYKDEELVVERLRKMLDDASLMTDQDRDNDKEDKVKLMTYHQAKGLEFKVVFMMGFEENVFPSKTTSNEEFEEERRCCYVGITRAKERLYITASKRRMMYGRMCFNRLSPFYKDFPYGSFDWVKK